MGKEMSMQPISIDGLIEGLAGIHELIAPFEFHDNKGVRVRAHRILYRVTLLGEEIDELDLDNLGSDIRELAKRFADIDRQAGELIEEVG